MTIWQLKLKKIFEKYPEHNVAAQPVVQKPRQYTQPRRIVKTAYDVVVQYSDNSYKVISWNFPTKEDAQAFANKHKVKVVFDQTHTEGMLSRCIPAERQYNSDGSSQLVVEKFPEIELSKEVVWRG